MQELLETFINKKSDKKKLIVIYGPTGSGKTAMSIDIAKQIDSEIISTDSRQIFCQMDIGTGKITEQEMQWIPHHMIDIIMPDIPYSLANFKEESEKILDRMYQENKIPMLVWGTGLYIDSLIYDFQVWWNPANKELRQNLEKQSQAALYKILEKIDPEYALELHPNNKQYIIRAIEVFLLTGKSKRELRWNRNLKYDVLFLSPEYGDRENLYTRINNRVDTMFTEWLENEVSQLISSGYDETAFGMKSIGYSEFFPYFKGEYGLETCKTLIKQHSRNYAKRQLTWFRKYEK